MSCATKWLVVVITLAVVTLAGCGRSGQETTDSDASNQDKSAGSSDSADGGAAPQSPQEKEPGAESPQALLKRLGNAFNKSDLDELVACTVPPSVDDAKRKQFRSEAQIVMSAQDGVRVFMNKGERKIGKDRFREILGAAGFALAMMSARPDFEAVAANGEVIVDGDTATVTYEPPLEDANTFTPGTKLKFKRVDGRWYYPLAESISKGRKFDESWANLQKFLEQGGQALDESQDASEFEKKVGPALAQFNNASGITKSGVNLRSDPPRRSSKTGLTGIFPQPAILPGNKQWQLETVAPRGAVESLAFTSDGRLLACGTNRWTGEREPEGSLRVYDVATQSLIFVSHGNIFSSVAWSPDDQWLATGSHDRTVRLWKSDGTPGPVFEGHRHFVADVAWSPDGQWLASASWDKTIRLWKSDGTPGPVLQGHSEPVLAVAWSPDGGLIASGGWDQTVRLWKPDGTPGPVLTGHSSNVQALAWSPDRKQLVSAGERDGLRFWQADGTLLRAVDGEVRQVAWSPDSQRIILVDHGVIFVKPDGTPGEIQVRHYGAQSIAWSPDGQWIASGGDQMDQTIRLWKPDGTAGPAIARYPWDIGQVLWSPAGDFWTTSPNRTSSGNQQRAVGVWKTDATLQTSIVRHEDIVQCVTWSPDGQWLATGCRGDEASVRIWKTDGTAGPVLSESEGDFGNAREIRLVAWSPDGMWLASVEEGGRRRVRLWKADGTPGPVLAENILAEAIMWAPDTAWLAALANDGRGHVLRLWKLDGSELTSIEVGGRFPAVAVNPNGDWIAVTGNGGRGTDVTLLKPDGTRGAQLKTTGRDQIDGVVWSPDGAWLAGFSRFASDVELWKADGTSGPTIKVGVRGLQDVSFSPRGDRIAVATRQFVGVWGVDGSQGPQLDMIAAETLAWHPDGERLLIGTNANSVALWNPSNSAPEWMTVAMPDGKSAAITGTGKLVHGDLSEVERHYLYVVKSSDNAIRYLKPSEFLSEPE